LASVTARTRQFRSTTCGMLRSSASAFCKSVHQPGRNAPVRLVLPDQIVVAVAVQIAAADELPVGVRHL
jgi:hypothetical protein